MKQLIFVLAILAAITATAQQGVNPVNTGKDGAPVTLTPQPVTTVNYRIDFIRPDSFYLVEIKTITSKPGERGKTEEESVLLRDTSQLGFIIKKSEEQENALLQKMKEYQTARAIVTELYGTLRERIKTANQ